MIYSIIFQNEEFLKPLQYPRMVLLFDTFVVKQKILCTKIGPCHKKECRPTWGSNPRP